MRTIMDITTLLIMGLLSFGLGGCSNAQNKQEYSNVKEIGNVPKENVDSYVYKMKADLYTMPNMVIGVAYLN